uniref:B-G antigen homologous n=1 Tax=Coturnix japonica TaxID=93934 RepID=Q76LL1_COTJA|nr:Chicken B-G antigen homologous [Coturnix japonica]
MGFRSGCRHLSFSHPWRTLLAHLVALHLLHLGSAQFRVVAPKLHVTATVGQDVVLHCQLSPWKDAWNSDIRWILHQSSGLVHHYRNGEDLEQMEEYKGRTELLRDGLIDGNLDLRITALTFADSGSYICAVQDGDDYAEAMVELKVSDPVSQIIHPWKVALAVVITILVGSFVIIAFLLRKQESKDAMLVEQAERMESSDAKLDTLAAKLVEITEKFEMRYGIMNFHTSDLKNQVAELEIRAVKIVERTEALEDHCEEMEKHTAELEEPSRRRLRDELRLAVTTRVQLRRARTAQDTEPTLSPKPQQDQEEQVFFIE